MEYIIAFVLILMLFVVYFLSNKKDKTFTKTNVLTKDELIQNYKNELLKILDEFSSDKKSQMEEKLKFLKRVNYELSMNIFFEKEELKKFIQELSRLEK